MIDWRDTEELTDTQQATILLVDSEPVFLASMVRKLRAAGVDRVDAAEDYESAAALARQGGYQAAVIDVSLPEWAGIELLREIKKKKPSTYCVMIAAYGDDKLVRRALEAGADRALIKPIHPDQLVWSLNQALDMN